MVKQKILSKPEVISFKTSTGMRKWLSKNYTKDEGILLQLYKKDSGIESVKHQEALKEALCFGWIDGQGSKYDENSWLVKFTPRRPKSLWSKRNIGIAEELIKTKKMRAPGLKAIKAAKSDGRWTAAYDSPRNMKVPDDFLKELSKNKKAEKFFHSLNKANTYAIAWRLQTAKTPAARKKKMTVLLEMLAEGKKLH